MGQSSEVKPEKKMKCLEIKVVGENLKTILKDLDDLKEKIQQDVIGFKDEEIMDGNGWLNDSVTYGWVYEDWEYGSDIYGNEFEKVANGVQDGTSVANPKN